MTGRRNWKNLKIKKATKSINENKCNAKETMGKAIEKKTTAIVNSKR